jgi:hypothetical protein
MGPWLGMGSRDKPLHRLLTVELGARLKWASSSGVRTEQIRCQRLRRVLAHEVDRGQRRQVGEIQKRSEHQSAIGVASVQISSPSCRWPTAPEAIGWLVEIEPEAKRRSDELFMLKSWAIYRYEGSGKATVPWRVISATGQEDVGVLPWQDAIENPPAIATEWWFRSTMVLVAYAIVAAAAVWNRWKVR